MTVINKIYKIYDSETNDFWNGRVNLKDSVNFWLRSRDAKWSLEHSCEQDKAIGAIKYDEQKRFTVIAFSILPPVEIKSNNIKFSSQLKRSEKNSYIYRIFDSELMEYWETRKNNKQRNKKSRKVWSEPRHAITSFNEVIKERPIEGIKSFESQDRFKIHELLLKTD